MRKSLYVKTIYSSDIGLQDWWPLEMLIPASRVAVMVTAKYGRVFERPRDLVPVLHIRTGADLDGLSLQGRRFIELIESEIGKIRETLALPGLLTNRPDFRATLEILHEATERLKDSATMARQIAGASLKPVVYEQSAADDYPGLISVVLAWNATLLKIAESYVSFVEGLPDELERILAAARAGQRAGLNLRFSYDVDESLMQEALERMAALQLLAVEREVCTVERQGRVYALVNPSMPGLIKIGKTTRTSELRADELNTTGVPTPFIVLFEVDVADCHDAERRLHAALASSRVSGRREFFRVEPKRAVAAMLALSAPAHITGAADAGDAT